MSDEQGVEIFGGIDAGTYRISNYDGYHTNRHQRCTGKLSRNECLAIYTMTNLRQTAHGCGSVMTTAADSAIRTYVGVAAAGVRRFGPPQRSNSHGRSGTGGDHW